MRGLAGAVGALMVASGIWAAIVTPSIVMTQFPMSLQAFFAIDLVWWIAFGIVTFLWSMGGSDVK